MAANISGIEVCPNTDDIKIPSCPHGPTILFEKCHQGHLRRFFACSACRDRKDCSFFQWADEHVSDEKKKLRDKCNSDQQPRFTQKQYWQRYKSFKKLKLSERRFCQDCGELMLPDDVVTRHQGHHVAEKVTLQQLRSPTTLMTPLDNNKKNAQYLFADKSVDFTLQTIRRLGFTKVLCVGAPRIHETIMTENKKSKAEDPTSISESDHHPLTSLLLDIDHRYAQFYSPKNFCRYNMFNHHFFEGERSERVFSEFVDDPDGKQVVMVTDPPFGGLVEVLATTMKKITEVWKADKTGVSELPVLWYFPYFMEPRITSCLPSFTMLDYKVAYDNHSVFQEGSKGRKYGSPVRIFTNIGPTSIPLPEEEGYRFCDMCDRYVSQENLHCFKCETCPSKDGSTYKHCDVCRRCVKPSRIHCRTCQQCVLQDHTCGVPTTSGCFVCGDLGHKRRECPKKGEIFKQKKRKKNEFHKSKKLKSK